MEEEYTEDKQVILEDKENDLPEDRVANAMNRAAGERFYDLPMNPSAVVSKLNKNS